MILFFTPLRSVIGEDLMRDLDALTNTRNVFAHGRRIGIEFDGVVGGERANPDSATLRPAAERLRRAGFSPRADTITRQNYRDWEASFFSDDALLYFYQKVVEIDIKLKSGTCSEWEKTRILQIPNLPVLAKD
jgi:hypothetical protein